MLTPICLLLGWSEKVRISTAEYFYWPPRNFEYGMSSKAQKNGKLNKKTCF